MELPVTLAPISATEVAPSINDSNIQLPKQLESVKVAQIFPPYRHRWNTNEEIASILLAFSRHTEWQQHEVKPRPPSGCCLLFNRNSVRYRKDEYCWKKRKDGKTIREDHMKLKVQGLECIYGSYVHSAILPTFHRRCYWLLQNPDIVLVHYLNVPYPSNAKLSIPVMSIAMEKKEWTKEELTQQLKPMFSSTEGDNSLPALDDSIQTLVQRLMDNQDKFKAEQNSEMSSLIQIQTKPTKTGPVSIQPDRSAEELKNTNHANSASTITQISTELVGQNPDSQKQVNFAQGVILNIGNLAKGQQVMLLTGQNNSTQLSILANSATTSGNAQLQSQESSASSSNIDTPTGGCMNMSNNNFVPPSHSIVTMANRFQVNSSSGHILARSASLCDTHNSFTQMGMQRSQSQDCGKNIEGPPKTCSVETHGRTDEINFGTCPSYSSGSFQNHQNVISSRNSVCDNSQQNDLPMNQSSGNNVIENQSCNLGSNHDNTNNLYHSLYSANCENSNSIVNSFLDELNSELMSTDRNSPGSENKRSFGHLGDSFESLQASLNTIPGTDLNLDQLDLMDVPDLEQMCNDFTNSGTGADISNHLNMTSENGTHLSQQQHHQQQKDQQHHDGQMSKCDHTNTNVSYTCSNCNNSILNSNTCSQTTSLHTNIFSPNPIASECSHAHLTNSCSTNATNANSQANCLPKYDCDISRSKSDQGHLVQGHQVHQGHSVHQGHARRENFSHAKTPTDIASITDFSPDWSYTEGQTKVLVTGPWHANMGTYSVLLDGKVTATTLVQNGVLRCFVPGEQFHPLPKLLLIGLVLDVNEMCKQNVQSCLLPT